MLRRPLSFFSSRPTSRNITRKQKPSYGYKIIWLYHISTFAYFHIYIFTYLGSLVSRHPRLSGYSVALRYFLSVDSIRSTWIYGGTLRIGIQGSDKLPSFSQLHLAFIGNLYAEQASRDANRLEFFSEE
ncbi:hypothetical protein WG66_003540 [Moniliophthora roreri]|nr:hypothetical protein WG66_003540 [Moniliophthora roreri]